MAGRSNTPSYRTMMSAAQLSVARRSNDDFFFDISEASPPRPQQRLAVAGFAFDLCDQASYYDETISKLALDQGSDESLWIEYVCVFENTTWNGRREAKTRSMYGHSRTGRVCKTVPRGAANVIPASTEERKQAKLDQEAMQRILDMRRRRSSLGFAARRSSTYQAVLDDGDDMIVHDSSS